MTNTNTVTEARSVVVERELPFRRKDLARAHTTTSTIEEWLMQNDFKPVVDHRFNLRADWGAVDCQVLAVEPNKTLSYTWGAYGPSVVTWTLTPRARGPSAHGAVGFRPDQQQAYQGASTGRSSLQTWSRSWRALIEVCRHNAKLGSVKKPSVARGLENNHEESDNHHEDEERLRREEKGRLSRCADRCENQGAE
jgi:uncharacterized protein YndB with AHSA1/START domain